MRGFPFQKYLRRSLRQENARQRAHAERAAASRRQAHRKYGLVNTVVRGLSGIPDRMVIKLKYADTVTITGAINTLTSYALNFNGVAIPDSAKNTQQPYYYDELKALYDGGVCYGSKIRARFLTASTGVACICGLRPQLDTTMPTLVSRITERPRTTSGIHPAGQRPLSLGMYLPCSALFGMKKTKVMDDHTFEFDMLLGVNPSHLGKWMLFNQNSDLATATDVVVQFTITYYCVLFQKKRVLAS